MNVDSLMGCKWPAAIECPLFSLQAWERLVAGCPESLSTEPTSGLLEMGAKLRIADLPGWEKVVGLLDDAWVFQYEQLQERLAKQQRALGQPQTGVFYTPTTVAGYLTAQTLGCFLTQTQESIERAMQQQNLQRAQELWAAVQQIRVIDPACGTGVFLVEALKLFSAFYQEIGQQYPALHLPNPAHFALNHQLAGIDLDPVSVMITELRLVQWVARFDKQVGNVDAAAFAFYCGDTLDDATWEQHVAAIQVDSDRFLPSIISAKKWQFILGNPPYVSEVRGQAKRFEKLQGSQSRYYQAKMDLCDGFLAWAIDHLEPGGQIAYVLPAYWTQRSSTASLRAALWQAGQIVEAWGFEGSPLFKNAPGHHSALLVWQKSEQLDSDCLPAVSLEQSRPVRFGHGGNESDLQASNLKNYWVTLEPKTGKFLLGDAVELTLLAKLSALSPLFQPDEIQQGLVIPQGRLKPIDRARLPQALQEGLSAEPGVFVLNETEAKALNLSAVEQDLLKPYYRPPGFSAFQGFLNPDSVEQIIYTDLKTRQQLDYNPDRYARLRAHLDCFASVNTSAFAPYGLHRSRQAIWFEDEQKILAPRQVLTPAFAPVSFPAYVNEGFLIVRSPENAHWLCALLNSDLAWFWFYHQKRKGVRLQIDKEVLNHFPQPPMVSPGWRAECITLAQQLALPEGDASARSAWLSQLNAKVNQAYHLTADEIEWVAKMRAAVLPV